MHGFQAVVFDFDGLILDTETPEFEAYRILYEEHGAKLTLERWSLCVGTDMNLFNPYDELARQLGRPVARDAVRARRIELYGELMRGQALRPGVRQYIQAAKEGGLRVGLASSSSREWVNKYLAAYGLLDQFDCICTRDDVDKVKPDPALYCLALDRLGVPPFQAVAFEDSPNGCRAAAAAGLRCVAVPNDLTRMLEFDTVDMRIGSMAEHGLRELLLRLSGMRRAAT